MPAPAPGSHTAFKNGSPPLLGRKTYGRAGTPAAINLIGFIFPVLWLIGAILPSRVRRV